MARCECGCDTDIADGRRFAHGHNRRGVTLSAETRAKITGRPISSDNRSPIHQWLMAHHPKAGACEVCGKDGCTDFAFLHHPKPHTRNRDDYRELCRSCHFKNDEPIIGRGRTLNAGQTREQKVAAGKAGAAKRWHPESTFGGSDLYGPLP